MTLKSSNRTAAKQVVSKPHPDFPLFPHNATGRWAKKVLGKRHYFGKTAGDEKGVKALERWLAVKDDLLAGRKPRLPGDGLTLHQLCNHFMTAKLRARDSGELAQRTYDDYFSVCDRMVKYFGFNRLAEDIDANDWADFRATFSVKLGPVSVANIIQRVRIVCKFGFDQGLLEKPMRFGQGFNKPSAKVLRRARADRGPMQFARGQVLKMLKKASIPMKAMILLGINCGFGNADCATLPKDAIDFRRGWITYPRPKTGIDRRCKVWPETLEALKTAIAARPAPKDAEKNGRLVFVTVKGNTWAKEIDDNPVSKEFKKILKAIKAEKKGLGFYTLRRTFATIAGGSLDQVAVNHVMGHSPGANDMAAVYRQSIEDRRLELVAAHVRKWLFKE